METYTISDAQQSLNKLLSDAHNGKHVAIKAENGSTVKLVPTAVRNVKPRKAGSARGKFKISDDFNAPLPEFDPHDE
ncbi:MAG: type II toxin-antitoxin system prevent-host-death family antitoxin [Chloroflexi bacterium]|nr:type II toxin-antitoxin system prevent-host-death family antitoxin [Chloroflexota bacterium]